MKQYVEAVRALVIDQLDRDQLPQLAAISDRLMPGVE